MASETATAQELERELEHEHRLVEEAQQGNLDAMRPLLERYASPLYGTVILPRLGDAAPKQGLPGAPPNLADPPPGCSFHPRCPRASEICRREIPVLEADTAGHRVACFHPATVERAA